MAANISALKLPAHQAPAKRPKSGAERAKAYRQRKAASEVSTGSFASEHRSAPVAALPPRTSSRPPIASLVLIVAAFGLAGVGVTMNGWFARSLGSSDVAGYLFLGIGVAADLAALAVPSVAALAWQARRRGIAVAGWLVWLVTFAFAVTAGIGFASTNITDVTMQRASRVTPAVTAAQTALNDAMTARDRECKGGVG